MRRHARLRRFDIQAALELDTLPHHARRLGQQIGKRGTGPLRHLERQRDKRKPGGVDADKQVVERIGSRNATVDRRRYPQKLGMHRLLRVSAHKPHALGQRMSRGKRHGKCRKGLGHGFLHIALLASVVKDVAYGAGGKGRNRPQNKADGR